LTNKFVDDQLDEYAPINVTATNGTGSTVGQVVSSGQPQNGSAAGAPMNGFIVGEPQGGFFAEMPRNVLSADKPRNNTGFLELLGVSPTNVTTGGVPRIELKVDGKRVNRSTKGVGSNDNLYASVWNTLTSRCFVHRIQLLLLKTPSVRRQRPGTASH